MKNRAHSEAVRDSDDEIPQEALAEIVRNRRGQNIGLKVVLPTTLLAALVAGLGFNVTRNTTTAEARSTIEERLAANERATAATATDVAVMKAQYANLLESLRQIQATLETMRQEQRRDRTNR